MNKTALLTIAASIFSFTVSARAEQACYKVEGMTCATCAITAKAAIKKLDGIQDVNISVGDKNAKVNFDPTKTTEDAIKNAIDKVGYKASAQQCKKG